MVRMSHIYLRFFCILTFAMAYFFCIYTNFNLPVIKQIIAHKFYVPVEVEHTPGLRNSFGCIAVNCSASRSLYNQNKAPCSGGSVLTNYTYEVSGETYDIVRHSYLQTRFCSADDLTAYYFPPYPAWSVFNNDMPWGIYWDHFVTTTIWFSGLLLFYLVFCVVTWARYKNGLAISHEMRQDSRAYLLIFSIFLPFVLIALFILSPLSSALDDWLTGVDHTYRDVLRVVSLIFLGGAFYGPSLVLLCMYFHKMKKLKYVLSAALTFAIFYFHMMMQGYFAFLIL